MLKELDIENLAVIEKAVVSFDGRFNVFTGETGAGKSILIGGISAILGGRVYKDIVRAGAPKAIVSALFDDIPETVRAKLTEYGYEAEEELLLTREISADGKSTARISGKAATAAILKDVAEGLIDIHGQHDNQLLMNNIKQREILDSYGNLGGEREEYAEAFRQFSALSKRIRHMQLENQDREERLAALTEKSEELSAYKFHPGEEEELSKKLYRLRNLEAINEGIGAAYSAINGADDEGGAYDILLTGKNRLGKLGETVPETAALSERLDSVLIELDDIRTELSALVPEEDCSELSAVEERMSDLLRLERKYGKPLDDILIDLEQWQAEIKELQGFDDTTDALQREKKQLADKVKLLAEKLTEKRKSTAERLSAQIAEELQFLDMPGVRLVFAITQEKVTVSGMDGVEMLISVNKGEDLKPVSRIASGGELSRIMLAIKSVLAEADNIPTMIFDEIDTGISGRAAQKVGIKLKKLARRRQVLCVTHLAQIAADADNQLLIEKKSDESRTFTSVYTLDLDGRRRELARIISGNEDNEAALRAADELLSEGAAIV